MDTILQSRLNDLESALTTLVDSLTSYNPSPSAAHTLVAADAALQSSLEDLAIHQRNHARIQQLQTTLQQRNDEIASTLQQLADTRASLLEIPNSLPPLRSEHERGLRDEVARGRETGGGVDAETLLAFAARVATYAGPVAFEASEQPTASAAGEKAKLNGETVGTAAKEGVGLAALIEEEKRWLDPWTGLQMTPWPSEEMIRTSELARLQAGDTFGVEVKEPAEGEADTVMGDVGSGERKEHKLGQGRGEAKNPEKPKVFGSLDLYDPDNDQ